MRYGERVERIVTEKSRVRGVALEDGEIVAARSVVAAADIRQTFHRLLDPGLVPADFRQLLAETPVSDTFVILSLVLDRDPAAWGFDRIDAYYTETPDIDRALTPNDPEHSMISLQFPEFHATRGDTRRHAAVRATNRGARNLRVPGSLGDRAGLCPHRGIPPAQRGVRRAAYRPGRKLHARAARAYRLAGHRHSADHVSLHPERLGAPAGWSYTSTQRWQQRVPFARGLYLAGHWVGPSGLYNVAQSGKNAGELMLRN